MAGLEEENSGLAPAWGTSLVDGALFETHSRDRALPAELTPGSSHILRTKGPGTFATDMLVTLVHVDHGGYKASAVGVTYVHQELGSVATIGLNGDGYVNSHNGYDDSTPSAYFLPVRSQDKPLTQP